MRRRRGMTERTAREFLMAQAATLLGPLGPDEGVSPRQLTRAIEDATAMLPRAVRRALGERGDGRYHPLAARSVVVRSRNAR